MLLFLSVGKTNDMKKRCKHHSYCDHRFAVYGVNKVCSKKMKCHEIEWTNEKVRQIFDDLGFEFPETEEQLKEWEERFKDYPFRLKGQIIDPNEIINDIE